MGDNMTDKAQDALARAIARNFQSEEVQRADAARAPFTVNQSLPEDMLELLSQLDKATMKTHGSAS